MTEDAFGRIAAALGVEPWMILAQAAGSKLDQVERFTEDERVWLDTYRALGPGAAGDHPEGGHGDEKALPAQAQRVSAGVRSQDVNASTINSTQ